MKIKKIIAAAAAAIMAVSMTAISAFATTVEIDSEYPGSWSSSGNGIKKADLEAVGGDIRIVLNVQVYDPLGVADQILVNPIDYDNGWISQTEFITSDTVVAKEDGWICVPQDATTIEFVYPASAVAALGDDGLCFSGQNILVKSADYELAAGPQAEVFRVNDSDGKDYCFGRIELDDPRTASSASTAAETPAATPASDSTTTTAATGNVPAAVMLSVMAAAGVVTVASRKRK